MTLPPTRSQSLHKHQHQLAQVAALGYRNAGRGAVVIFSDARCSRTSNSWLGTEYPYFLEDCLLRRLIRDVWLRHHPDRCSKTLADFVQTISTYDPMEGMVVVVLASDGEVSIHHILFDKMSRPASAAVPPTQKAAC